MIKLLLLLLSFPLVCIAQLKSAGGKGLNSDPNVIYVEDLTTETIKLRVKKESSIFSDKNGKRRIGTLKAGTLCELIGFDHRAFKIKGEAKHGTVTGWVSPHALESNDPDMVESFKKFYEREISVKKFIQEGEVAIGMTPEEVSRVLGEPTKKTLRSSANGTAGTYEYLTFENVDHFQTLVDGETGQLFQSFSHTTKEVTERIAVEFENGVVSALEQEEDRSKGKRNLRIITGPVFLNWRNNAFR